MTRAGEGGSSFVMNGEIYNWREIAVAAGLATDSDARAAHAAVDRLGPNAISRFRGAFALAILDRRGRRLRLARDGLGQKPLYWARLGGALVFGSEIRALLAAGVPAKTDDVALAELVRLQFHRPGRTLFQGIHSLRPGEFLEASLDDDENLSISSRLLGFAGDRSLDPAAIFRESLRLQGDREQPAGLLLSGGLDSTAIATGLARAGRAPQRAWVGWFPDEPRWDERRHARVAAAAAGIPLEEVAIAAGDFGDALPATSEALGEPVAGPGSVSQFILCRRAAQDVKILFGGQGGDELFGGYERLRILQALEIGDTSSIPDCYRPLLDRMERAWSKGRHDRWAAYRAAIDRASGTESIWGDRLEGLRADLDLDAILGADLERASSAEAAAAFELRVLLPGLLLVDDRTSSWFGLEGRSPFLDQRLVSAVQGISLADKSPPTAPRQLFRRLFGDLLPESIANRRTKLGFPVPLARWWRGPLRDLALDTLGSVAARDRGLVRSQGLDSWVADDGAGGRGVFFMVMLELWHRRWIDGARAPSPPSKTAVEVIACEGAA